MDTPSADFHTYTTAKHSGREMIGPQSFLEFLENRIANNATAIESGSIATIADVLSDRCSCDADVNESHLRIWLAEMIDNRYSPQTINRYFRKLHSLYLEYRGVRHVAEDDPFEAVRPLVMPVSVSKPADLTKEIKTLKHIATTADRMNGVYAVYAKVLLWAFYSGGATVADAITATFDTAMTGISQCDDIVEGLRSPRRRYIFPLEQGKRTDKKIGAQVASGIAALLSHHGVDTCGVSIDDFIANLWIAAARTCGVALERISSVVRHIPDSNSHLSLIDTATSSHAEREQTLQIVADYVNDIAPCWFVMRMRHGVKLDDIARRLDEVSCKLSTFYPCNRVVEHHGRKKVTVTRPVLPGIVFFRMRRDRVAALFAVIGDLAYCFRQNNTPTSDYAIIPNREMKNFQLCIGLLTSDMEVRLVDNDRYLAPGREVEIIGGIYAGYVGTIIDCRKGDEPASDRRMFRISLSNNMSICWTVSIDERFIRERNS